MSILNNQNSTNKNKNIVLQHKQVEVVYEAPLPPPQILAEYEKIHSGTANIIIEVFEKQANHRIDMEKTVIVSATKQRSKGQWFAFIISICLMLLAFFALKYNHPVVASIICSTTLVSIIYTFITGNKAEQKNQNNQSKK